MTNKTRHILCMSGGKDSTALALFMRDQIPEMEYVFCDTDKELDETYEYLDRIEAYLGKKIVRLSAEVGFDHWLDVFGGYLPSPSIRWCTKMLKLKPFEAYVGDCAVTSYVGIRADEDRVGYISTKPNIKTVYPFKEAGIDYVGVMKILEDSGIGMPPYLQWGRTHSGCFFCFFQRPIEWVRLLENHPEQFAEAQSYEKISSEEGKTFTWIQGLPLSELRKPEAVNAVKEREAGKTNTRKRINQRLVQILCDMDDSEQERGCLICHL
jgi:hypothetical protein